MASLEALEAVIASCAYAMRWSDALSYLYSMQKLQETPCHLSCCDYELKNIKHHGKTFPKVHGWVCGFGESGFIPKLR